MMSFLPIRIFAVDNLRFPRMEFKSTRFKALLEVNQ
jgi:hypothetical protein